MSSANNDSFTSSFATWLPFMSSCLIAEARTFSTVLNKSGENEHPCLILLPKRNAFCFIPLIMMFALSLSYCLLLGSDLFPVFPFCCEVLSC